MTQKKVSVSKISKSEKNFLAVVVDAIQDKKAEEIRVLDLRSLKNRVCDFFIVCEGSSTTQVRAIADSVKDKLKKELKAVPYHSEGYDNLEWVLLDYVNVVVHVFLPNVREFYNIEGLWADAQVTAY